MWDNREYHSEGQEYREYTDENPGVSPAWQCGSEKVTEEMANLGQSIQYGYAVAPLHPRQGNLKENCVEHVCCTAYLSSILELDS